VFRDLSPETRDNDLWRGPEAPPYAAREDNAMKRRFLIAPAVVGGLLAFQAAALGAQGGAGAPPAGSHVGTLLASGGLMGLVGVAYVVAWKRRSRVALRWFWAGAGIWTVGVALKILAALLLNKPVLRGMEHLLPRVGYWIVGSVYIGLLTGIFEIGVTFLAARKWRSLAGSCDRALAVGIGAGAFEAMLLGVAGLATLAVLASHSPAEGQVRAALAAAAATTPVEWLVGPVERVMAVLCHASSRALVLMSVATGRRAFFWYGFLLMTGLDAVAGAAHITGRVGRINLWWVELAVLPFAIASIAVIRWCVRRWPR